MKISSCLLNHCGKRIPYFFSLAIYLVSQPALTQQIIKGTVYDSTGVFPLQSVSVLTNSGRGTSTDKNGNYEFEVNKDDSIWFSYLNKPTRKYAVKDIINPFQFTISLYVGVPVLKEVKIRPPNYRLDSIQNRIDYAKGFNYRKPTFKSVVPAFGFPFIVVDLDELIRAFQYQKKRNALAFQRRLIQEEQDKFIDHRFTKSLVSRLTSLSGNERDSFMIKYRPSFEFTKKASDYEFYLFIRNIFIQDSVFSKSQRSADFSRRF